ncbi:MAG: hypothetical protein H6600_05400 [Flavobacteriales bacterium]|nr:hypothetical protein [Flavobacteriales bacterium]
MKFLGFITGVILSLPTFGIGGEWFVEVYFLSDHGTVKNHGYVQCAFWITEEKVVANNFISKFSQNEAIDSIKFYSNLTDRTLLKTKANFPMHEFEVDRENFHCFALKDLQISSIGKVYSRIDYEIHVLSPIELSDTSWIGQDNQRVFYEGEDIGCRLEVYEYDKYESMTVKLIELLVGYYRNAQLSHVNNLVKILYRRNVIVVELCGC